jgi:ATP-dependent DNA helicase PIF1
MELNEGQKKALSLVKSRQNIFLTGQAGTGKSELIKHVKKLWESDGRVIAITSLTGVSALSIGGNTIHSWAGIGLGELAPVELLKKVRKKSQAKNWKNTDLLVIDEISMMSPDLMMKLDFVARGIRRIDSPFGGIQLLLAGDMCQLPAVKTDVYCFEGDIWPKCKLTICHLTENMRQDDPLFQRVLSQVRMGYLSPEGLELLQSCVRKDIGLNGIIPTKMFPHRKSVDEVNEKGLKAISREQNPLQRFEAVDFITSVREVSDENRKYYMEALNKACQAKAVLDLLVGAQVMLIHNVDLKSGLVNGARGIVIRFEEYRPVVKFMSGLETIVQCVDWEVKISDDITVSRRQIPLILAYGTTVHKSQGQTLDCVEMDLGDDLFAAGQFYTALSRVRSTAGLCITNLSTKGLICDPKVRAFYEQIDK